MLGSAAQFSNRTGHQASAGHTESVCSSWLGQDGNLYFTEYFKKALH